MINLYNCAHSYHSFMFTSCSLECASVSSDHIRFREILSASFLLFVSVSALFPACPVFFFIALCIAR